MAPGPGEIGPTHEFKNPIAGCFSHVGGHRLKMGQFGPAELRRIAMCNQSKPVAIGKTDNSNLNGQSVNDNHVTQEIHLWFDGSTTQSQSGGRIGWAVTDVDLIVRASGSLDEAPGNSSQSAELQGFLAAILLTPEGRSNTDYLVIGDSNYAINLINLNWIARWKQRGWRLSKGGKAPAHLDLIIAIDNAVSLRPNLRFKWEARCSSEPGRLADAVSRAQAFGPNCKKS